MLPGVGAARATIDSLAEQDLVDALAARVHTDRVPFLGICIGLQVLFDHSEEGDTPCLGWVPGTVRRFPSTDRVPQIGWNSVRFTRDHPVTQGAPRRGPLLLRELLLLRARRTRRRARASPTYTTEFCSVVARDNVVATQFHAEKSGELGLALLRGFASWEPSC